MDGKANSISEFPNKLPEQKQDNQPGIESIMNPRPIYDCAEYKTANKLEGKIAIITGGDSGIGRAVALAFAKEGADIAIIYLNEHKDAEETKMIIETTNHKCLLIAGDIGEECFCKQSIQKVISEFGKLDIVVNNAAEEHEQNGIEDITEEQLQRTFKTNIFSMFYITKAALPHLKENSCIINTTSITAYKGNETLIDYSSTKGAIVSFTRSLALSLAKRKIRVNGVAPGPIWTPLIPSCYDAPKVAKHGADTKMGRAGQPAELAPAYVYLACSDSSYMTGQILHINGGEIVNG